MKLCWCWYLLGDEWIGVWFGAFGAASEPIEVVQLVIVMGVGREVVEIAVNELQQRGCVVGFGEVDFDGG